MSDRIDQLQTHLRDDHGLDLTGLDLDTPLFVSGRLDSLGLVDLIVFIERSWKVKVPWSDVELGNLGTMASILKYVERRAAAG